MNIDQTISDLFNLSVDDRLPIVQKLWDSIPPDTEVTVSPDQRAELERRIAAHDADPNSAVSRDEIERRIQSND